MRKILASKKACDIIANILNGVAKELYAYKLGNLSSYDQLEEFVDDNCDRNYIAKGENIEDVEEYIEVATLDDGGEIIK